MTFELISYEQCLKQISERDERLIVMTAENRAAIRNLPPLLGNRFIDVGICEQTMVGAAAGLALRGRRPVIHALATFLTLRAFEFVRTDVGIAGLPVTLVGGVPGFLSEANGPTHQAIEDISLMRGIPQMQVFCPSDEQELVAALPKIVDSGLPAYVRFNASTPAVEHTVPFEIGKAETLSKGKDVTLLTYGFLLREVERARGLLGAQGIGVRLINLRTVKPIDEEAIVSAAHETKQIVIVEDHFVTGGVSSIVAELFLNKRITTPVHSIALEHRWFKPALLDDVLRYEGFTGEQISARVMTILKTDHH